MAVTDDLLLVPRPRVVRRGDGIAPDRAPTRSTDPSLPPQGYRLSVRMDGIGIASSDDAGAFYAQATLEQLRRGGGGLPVVEISDHPDLAVRGVMLDVSRDKVPTLDTLRALVDRLASLKYNQLQLYIEHTFAHAGHEEVWAASDAYTCEEMRELDTYCRERHVELVPNRNCLGHMERWLRHDRYRPLAVTSDPTVEVFGRHIPVPTIDPRNPASMALVRELLAEITSCFSSSRVHVGLDEPWGLPDDRIAEWIDHLAAIRALPDLRGRDVLVWADVPSNHPELIASMPAGVTVCEWGYESWHPFAQNVRRFRDAGLAVWVCPGTSSWMSLAGRWTNARANIESAADAGRTEGAEAFLLTDWGDMGHHQYLPVSEPMFAWGAAMAWCADANRGLDLTAVCDRHVFADEGGALTHAIELLADAYSLVSTQLPNTSILAVPFYFPGAALGTGLTAGITAAELDAVDGQIDRAVEQLRHARPARTDGALVLEELRTTADLLSHLVADARLRLAHDGTLASIPSDGRRTLAAGLAAFPERHAALWLARNREGGLADSLGRFERLAERYSAGT